jgi:hypothetical protein
MQTMHNKLIVAYETSTTLSGKLEELSHELEHTLSKLKSVVLAMRLTIFTASAHYGLA